MRGTMLVYLKKLAKAAIPHALQTQLRAFRALPRRMARLERQVALLAAHQARHAYGNAAESPSEHSVLNRHELQVYAQHGEDGILQFLFDQIGVTNGSFVEFGMGDGRECNTAWRSLHEGWRGLLMDGDPERTAIARAHYRRMLGPEQSAVRIVETWVTAENINALLRENAPAGELDLLSVDLDGIDYWVWKAIDAVNPRVVVIEYSAVLGWERSLTVPYDSGFSRWMAHPSGLYAGASLAALAQLGRAKGYRLVGCNRHGVNAFFVREDIAPDSLPAMTPEAAYYPCEDLVLGLITPDRFSEVADLPWEWV